MADQQDPKPALGGETAPAVNTATNTGANDDLAELGSLLTDTEQLLSSADIDEKQFDARRQSEDRSKIAKLIVWVFAIILILMVLFIILGSFTKLDMQWADGANVIKDVLSSVMLPVVTLVLGFYFGTEKR